MMTERSLLLWLTADIDELIDADYDKDVPLTDDEREPFKTGNKSR